MRSKFLPPLGFDFMNTIIATLLLSFAFLTPGDDTAPKFPLGKETTYVDGPLDKDGNVDYQAALNDLLGKGIKPENNANVLLWRALGPAPEGGKKMPAEFFKRLGMDEPPESGAYFIRFPEFLKEHLKVEPPIYEERNEIERVTTQRPWSAKDFPNVAAWLEANEKPLAIIVEATRRPDYFSPIVSDGQYRSILSARFPGVQICRYLAVALVTRSMLRIENGKLDLAWQDLLAAHRLGRLVGRGATLIEGLVGFAIDAKTTTADLAYLQFANLNSQQTLERLNDLKKLPSLPSVADKVEYAERFLYLESLQTVRRYGVGWIANISGGESKKATPEELKILNSIDWTPALKSANRYYNLMVGAMRLKSRAEREAEFDKFGQDLAALKSDERLATLAKILAETKPMDRVSIAKDIGDILIALVMPALWKVRTAQDRGAQTESNLHVAFALAAFHADNGRYPAQLADLAPKYLASVPDDLFSGQALIYRPNDKSYLLYSVGPNDKDDGGRGKDDDPPGDDLVVKMPLPELKKKK